MTPRPAAAAPRHPSPLSVLPSPTALRAMPADTRVRTLETCLRRELELRLRVPPAHRLSAARPLRRQGVHPLLALQLQRALKRELGIEIPADLLYEGTLGEAAAGLAAGLAGGSP